MAAGTPGRYGIGLAEGWAGGLGAAMARDQTRHSLFFWSLCISEYPWHVSVSPCPHSQFRRQNSLSQTRVLAGDLGSASQHHCMRLSLRCQRGEEGATQSRPWRWPGMQAGSSGAAAQLAARGWQCNRGALALWVASKPNPSNTLLMIL